MRYQPILSGASLPLRQYPLIVEALSEPPEETVVDGEVVALDQSGFPNFNLLQNYRSEASRIHFFIFDLLVYKGRDLMRLPLIAITVPRSVGNGVVVRLLELDEPEDCPG